MKLNNSTKVSIRVMSIFGIAIILSFIPDLYHSFFGDWLCNGSGLPIKDDNFYIFQKCNYTNMVHDSSWHWGYRHWLWFFMGICLAISQIVNIISLIEKE